MKILESNGRLTLHNQKIMSVKKSNSNQWENKPLILIVDDSADNLRVLATALQPQNYEVRCVKSGAMALLAIEATRPDLILLDIKMPEMDGYQLCQRLKSQPETTDIPVIFLSALEVALDKVRAFEVGGADYITKPFQIEEVLIRVKNQLTLQQLQKQLIEKNQRLSIEISEHQKTEIELQKALATAADANRVKSEFLANMSHELRTPLNAILGFARLLEWDESLNTEQLENLSIIRRSAEDLLALINDVLDMSKIEAGRLTCNPQNFDLYVLLETLEDIFQLRANSRNLQLIFDSDPKLPQYIKADESKLRQVLLNIISNALKFTFHGGVAVRIKVDHLDNNQKQLFCEVEDTGMGIAQEEMVNLFQPFVQTRSGQQSNQGTGLGLAISKRFLQLMGGDIQIKSVVDQGTTVTFYLPITIISAEVVHAELPTPIPVGIAANSPTYKILVADDKWTNRKLLVKILQSLGFEVQEAENGQKAVESWQNWRPNLILMDIRMPVIDGLEAARQIKASLEGQATVIIALSASSFEEDRIPMLSAGCDDFIRKPFREGDIYEKLSHHLGVEFVYADKTVPVVSRTITSFVTANDIQILPVQWRADFYQAVLALDLTVMIELLEAIRPQYPQIADYLTELANQFQYDKIQSLFLPMD
jgi:signal transduction histidine kinase